MENNMFQNIKEEMLKDIQSLVEIPSVLDEQSKAKYAPFGTNIQLVFEKFKELSIQKGFYVEEDEGYAISAQIGNGEDYIGVLGHLDIVDAGDFCSWDTPPYEMTNIDGVLYGRGVNDDKGPLIAALYAAYLMKQQNLPLRYPIRIIAGGAEETTWECMEHYFKHHKQPIFGFSPDGNFPIVNGEKGILQVRFLFPVVEGITIASNQRLNYVCDTLYVEDTVYGCEHKLAYKADNTKGSYSCTYQGVSALSRNPQRGDNAIYKLAKDYKNIALHGSFHDCITLLNEQFTDDFYGEKSGLYAKDDDMGTTSVCAMSLTCNKDVFEVCVDIRYVKIITEDMLMKRLQEIATRYHATLEVIKKKRLLFVEEQSEYIQGLKKAYRKVMKEEAEVLTKGGASYARVLEHGVAFGATFEGEDPHVHMSNERMPVASLLKACEIYYEALYELAVDTEILKGID